MSGALVADYGTSVVTLHLGEHLRPDGAWEAVETGKDELRLPDDGGATTLATMAALHTP